MNVRYLAVAAALAAPAFASSPDAWAEYETEVKQACFAATGFKDPAAHTSIIGFDDAVGYDALIVTGVYPQPHMDGAKGEMLCLFDKKTRKAVAAEFSHAE